ncbi:fragile histidine triad protein [Cokeromyces recurvatus]|uniref:fragile histidine triad protein n=1 Tax=Cokeromyces recurvatus TaxID=90255 RepID=UPI002220B89F|nr:fragile histidine triad protein [Cokeromyces recurvatus]KAI7904907.1 fragile histidine triad protein [Cokeromyces recurvatus]
MNETVKFGKFNISKDEVFYESEYSMGIVNLKPITQGHVLVAPKRNVSRYSLLSIEEIIDLTNSAREICEVLKDEYLNMKQGYIWLIQDGKEAGQTVPHVHLHIIPKRFSEWYQSGGVEDQDRIPRSIDEMKKEASRLKIMFKK